MVEKSLLFPVFFPVFKCAEGFFFQTANLFGDHCCVYKNYRIIPNYKVLELFSQVS